MPKKEKLVTRALTVTAVKCMIVDTTSKQVTEQVFRLSGRYKAKEKMKKAIEAELEGTPLKCVNVLTYSEEKILYGRTESDFLAGAREMITRTKFKEAE